MRKKGWIIVVALGALIAAGIVTWAVVSPKDGPDVTLDQSPAGWPVDQTRSWTFNMPPGMLKGDHIGLVVRVKSVGTSDERKLEYGTVSSIEHADAERTFGTSLLGGFDGSVGQGKAVVQLLDLSKIGIASSVPGRDLRLLASINVGGGGTTLSGEDSILPAGQFHGSMTRGDGGWNGGECLLMSFKLIADDTVSRYDILLRHRPAGADF